MNYGKHETEKDQIRQFKSEEIHQPGFLAFFKESVRAVPVLPGSCREYRIWHG